MEIKKFPSISTNHATDSLFSLMCMCGMISPKRFRLLYFVYAFVFIGLSAFYMPFAFTVALHKELNLDHDLSAFFTTLQVSYCIFCGSSKFICIGVMMHKLRATRIFIDRLDSRCWDAAEVDEQRNLVQLGRRIVIVTTCIYFSYAISTSLGAVLNGRPPYSLYLPFIDWRRSNQEFLLSSFIEFVLIDICCMQQVVNDTYAIIYVCILRSHVRTLLMRVSKLGTDDNLSPQQNLANLKQCIQDHKTLLELQQTIGSVISITVFFQFSVTAAALGTTLLNIAIFSTSLSMRLGSYLFIAAVTVQSFPLCFFAQSLKNEADKLPAAILHSHWMNQSREYRKMLIFFIQRSQHEMCFSAGKLFPVTLKSFLSIAKFSFSLYTLIEKMDLKEKFKFD